jgi:hypothetical protein
VLASLAAFAPHAGAQTLLATAAEGRAAPSGAVVISVRPGAKVAVVATREKSALVTIEGWVDASRLAGKLDSFPASVDSKAPLRVRASASATAPILAELRPRSGVTPLAKSGTWTRIRRSAWIPSGALPKPAAGKSAAPEQAKAVPQAAAPSRPPAAQPANDGAGEAQAAPPGAMSVSQPTKLLASPGGKALGEIAAGATVQAVAHDHGFAKVRIEGWVPEKELSPADSSAAPQLTAADLRSDPEGTRGKMVQWEVEVLSLQTADPLRRELARDEPYLLAKGPGGENALLYLAVPPSLLNQAKALPPLTRVLITARVRSGHSEPLGTPILDLKSISKR